MAVKSVCETCQRCAREIGLGEEAMLWQEKVLCKGCYDLMVGEQTNALDAEIERPDENRCHSCGILRDHGGRFFWHGKPTCHHCLNRFERIERREKTPQFGGLTAAGSVLVVLGAVAIFVGIIMIILGIGTLVTVTSELAGMLSANLIVVGVLTIIGGVIQIGLGRALHALRHIAINTGV